MSMYLDPSPEPNWHFLRREHVEVEQPAIVKAPPAPAERPAGVSYASKPVDPQYAKIKRRQISQLFFNHSVNRSPSETPEWFYKA